MPSATRLLLAATIAFAVSTSGCSRSPSTPAQVTTTPDDVPDTAATPRTRPCDGCGKRLPSDIGASTCKLVGELPGPTGLKLVPAFPKLALAQPIHLTHPQDGTDRIIVATRPGEIWVFANAENTSTKTRLLDLRSKVSTKGEGGLLSVAYHPNYAKTRKVFVNYTPGQGAFRTVVAEFTAGADDVLNPASERSVLEVDQPYSNHDGGHILFDKTGMLLVAMGDGGWANDPKDAGQDKLTLLGKILRLDVDNIPAPKAYSIPKDNPFVGDASFRPEIWAWGLRNPWRCTIDRVDGKVWCGDVGQNKYEEIDIIHKGGNYGWRKMEGLHCFNPTTDCDDGSLVPPVAEIKQPLGKSITGGEVYRGTKQPGLFGAYIFADYVSGRYWTTRAVKSADGKTSYETKEALNTATKPVSFGADRDGEVYVMQLFGSPTVFRVVQDDAGRAAKQVPARLSQTGCFATLKPLVPAQGLVPYDVNAPLWSDGADKDRWLVLPAGAAPDKASPPLQAPAGALDAWEVPIGTIAIKHFRDGATALETRFIERRADGWRFLTYVWRADGSDADLWQHGTTRTFATAAGERTWTYPSQDDCAACHALEKGSKLLGFATAQLDRVGPYEGRNQLDVWRDGGLLGGAARDPKATVFTDPHDAKGDATTRARTYLHVQCASCHQPASSASTKLDLRYDRPLQAIGACDEAPQEGDLGIAGAKLLAPGAPEKSVLLQRMETLGADFMPERGVSIPDAAGIAQVKAWIAGLKSCE